MSKNQSSLLNFFQKKPTPSPAAATKPTDKPTADRKVSPDSSKENDLTVDNKQTPTNVKRSSSKRVASAQRGNSVKRTRVVLDSDESEHEENVEEEDAKSDSSVDEGDLSQIKKKYKEKAARGCPPRTPKTPKGVAVAKTTPKSTKSFLGNFSFNEGMDTPRSSHGTPSRGAQPDGDGSFKHFKFEFLQPDKIRDADGRLRSHPDYDKRTLRVPEGFLRTQTPAIRQWWIMKSKHFDTILFFKVGKFYELYHMDAVIAVEKLNLAYMKGDYAHCGFPEASFARYSEQLVARGYKVARVEQTETPDALAARNKQMNKPDKVVRREICQVSTPGTRCFSPADAIVEGGAQTGGTDAMGQISTTANQSTLLLAEGDGTQCAYGVCISDTTEGLFKLGSFDDDVHRSRLRTLLAHYPPSQVLYERGKCSKKLTDCLRNACCESLLEALAPNSEFWGASRTLCELARTNYLGPFERQCWPPPLIDLIEPSDCLGQRARDEKAGLALSALGACIWYLRGCLIDVDQISTQRFEPLSIDRIAQPGGSARTVVLDGATLHNLNIVPGSGADVGRAQANCDKSTLFAVVNRCRTPFGRRVLRQWLCAPLFDVGEIELRQRAVAEIRTDFDHETITECENRLNKLPDLPRLLQRLHTLGLKHRASDHPDSRAVMFDSDKYARRKIMDLLGALAGFVDINRLAQFLHKRVASQLLRRLFIDDFPDMTADLAHFETSFDHSVAKSQGAIIPNSGLDKDYDEAIDRIREVETCFEKYLGEQIRHFRTSNLTYVGTGRSRYQLEIPEMFCKNLPSDFEFKSQRKGFKRFSSEKTKQLFGELCEAEAMRDVALKDIARRVFADFDKSSPSQPVFEVVDGSHAILAPMFESRVGAADFISNDTSLTSGALLLTGPNMGGKSTLMRQIGLIAVLAHCGCYVPAAECQLTVVDRIFTRIGASDRILAGESTFYVELAETSAMLQHATKQSLLLIDELGRGTSTHDGTAIAAATLKQIVNNIGCLTIFSTHYHSLVQRFNDEKSGVQLGHMACMVETSDDPSKDSCGEESVTFLYKLVPGACPKSYGFHAAALAGLQSGNARARQWSAMVMGDRGPTKQDLKKLLTLAKDDTELVRMFNQVCFGE